jgi:hypothetical protein
MIFLLKYSNDMEGGSFLEEKNLGKILKEKFNRELLPMTGNESM